MKKKPFSQKSIEDQQTLVSFKKRTDALLSQTPREGLFVSSVLNGEYYYVSESYCKIKGYPPKKFYEGGAEFFIEHLHPEDWNHHFSEYITIQHEISYEEFDRSAPRIMRQNYRVKHASGKNWIPLNVRLMILNYTDDGRADKIMGLIQDRLGDSTYPPKPDLALEEKLFNKTLELVSIYRDHYNEPINDSIAAYNPKALMETTLTSMPRVEVTKREKEVLRLVANGLIDKQIAEELSIAFYTAVNHRKNLIKKFGAKNTAELIKKAFKHYYL